MRSLLALGLPFLLSSQILPTSANLLLSARSQDAPKTISVPFNKQSRSNDGSWSTFPLQIGAPEQVIDVLVSTSGYQLITVLRGSCTVNCSAIRGGTFEPNFSTTWENITANGTNSFPSNLDTASGLNQTAWYGFDNVSLSTQSGHKISAGSQTIVGIETEEIYIGLLGLSPRSTNFTKSDQSKPSNLPTLKKRGKTESGSSKGDIWEDVGESIVDSLGNTKAQMSKPSLLQSLKHKGKIASLSWGYTAGNLYATQRPGNSKQEVGAVGSLTLGGYDASRCTPENATFKMNTVPAKELTVNIKSVDVFDGLQKNGSVAGNGSDHFAAVIDSTVSEMWLPENICRRFEQAFNLTWNETSQKYSIDDTYSNSTTKRGSSVTLWLTNSTEDDGSSSDKFSRAFIHLPYEAFYQSSGTIGPALFPLRRAANESQYTLGRVFLQAA